MRDRGRWWKFDEMDIGKIILGAMVGFILKSSLETLQPVYLAIGVLTGFGVYVVVMLAREAIGDLREVKGELEKDLGRVHTVVHFAPQKAATKDGILHTTTTESYLIAKRAVESACRRIWVIGDYNPPRNIGDTFVTPERRSDYLHAIIQRLENQVKSGTNVNELHYMRIIQRPLDVYSQMVNRATVNNVTLVHDDMAGDEEVFDHCQEAYTLNEKYRLDSRINIDLFVVPYLPNSPSVLLIDDKELQFTIPTRVGSMSGAGAAHFELLGILQFVAKRDAQLPLRFSEVFDSLRNIGSLRVTKVAT